MKRYLNGAKTRLHYLKGQHGDNWRTWVHFNVNPTSMGQGFNGSTPIWYTQAGAEFRDERFCDEIVRSINHTGWFGDCEHQENKFRGIVARLPHGRFIAGYLQEDNDERVYFPEVFKDEDEAARMADEHARVIAEQEDEYSQRWHEANKLDSLIEEKTADVEKAFALRNHPKLGRAAREECRDIIADIRAFRQERAALKVE